MIQYLVEGNDRMVGAIGWPTSWHLVIQASDCDEAKEKARSQRYQNNREHVHIWGCKKISS